MKNAFSLLVLLLLSPTGNAQAQSRKPPVPKPTKTLLSQELQQKEFETTPGTCSLKRFSVLTKKTDDQEYDRTAYRHRLTGMAAIVETNELSCLREYAVVQFIRGCIYSTSIDHQTKQTSDYFGVNREFKGEFIRFQHRDWVVDSVDPDPMYHSNPEDSSPSHRFDFMRTPIDSFLLQNNPKAIAHDLKIVGNKIYSAPFIAQEPTKPVYFVTDHPSPGSFSNYYSENGDHWTSITNTSLEFKTCIYRTAEVPTTGEPALEKALHCFEWNHQNIYNLETKTFNSPKEIAPFCQL